jgi:hypothetical protein
MSASLTSAGDSVLVLSGVEAPPMPFDEGNADFLVEVRREILSVSFEK